MALVGKVLFDVGSWIASNWNPIIATSKQFVEGLCEVFTAVFPNAAKMVALKIVCVRLRVYVLNPSNPNPHAKPVGVPVPSRFTAPVFGPVLIHAFA